MVESCRTIVKWVLENEVEARNNDDLLVAIVDARTNKEVLSVPYTEVMKNRARYHLYPIESVTRVRRMLQEEFEELKGCDFVTRRRTRKEKEYREYFSEKKKERKSK